MSLDLTAIEQSAGIALTTARIGADPETLSLALEGMAVRVVPPLLDEVRRLQRIESAARTYVLAVNKDELPHGCATWDDAEEQTLEALHAALGFR